MGKFDWFGFGKSAASSALGALFGQFAASRSQKYNERNMRIQQMYGQENMQMQHELNKDYQDFVWDNSAPRAVAAMKNAGLNPAGASTSLAGSQIAGAPASANMPSSVSPQVDFAGGIAALSNARLNMAKVQGQEIENAKEAIELKRKEDFASSLESKTTYWTLPNSDTPLSADELQHYRDQYREGKIKDEDMPVLNIVQGQSQGQREAERFKVENQAAITEAKAKDSVARLERKVADTKYNNDSYSSAVASIPNAELQKIRAEIERVGLDNFAQDFYNSHILGLQEKLLSIQVSEADAGSITSALAHIKDPSASIWDKFVTLLLYALKSLGGVNFSIGASKKL